MFRMVRFSKILTHYSNVFPVLIHNDLVILIDPNRFKGKGFPELQVNNVYVNVYMITSLVQEYIDRSF